MATSVSIVPATEAHCRELAPVMRPEDCAEVRAVTGLEPLDVLLVSVSESRQSWAGYLDGELATIFGIRDITHLSGTALIWALSGPRVEERPVGFVRACRHVLPYLLSTAELIFNAIDCRHSKALRWAKHLGFSVGEPQPYGVEQLPFRLIWMRKEPSHV